MCGGARAPAASSGWGVPEVHEDGLRIRKLDQDRQRLPDVEEVHLQRLALPAGAAFGLLEIGSGRRGVRRLTCRRAERQKRKGNEGAPEAYKHLRTMDLSRCEG